MFIVIPVIAIYFLQCKSSTDILKDKIFGSTQDLLVQYSQVMDKRFEMIDTYLLGIVRDKNVKSFIRETKFDSYDSELFTQFNKMNSFFLETESMYSDLFLYSLTLIPPENNVYSYKNAVFTSDKVKIRESKWYKETILLNGKTNWIGWTSHFENITFDIAKAIIDEETNKIIGVVYLSLYDISGLLPVDVNDGTISLYDEYRFKYIPLFMNNANLVHSQLQGIWNLKQGSGYYEADSENGRVFVVYSPPNSYGMRVIKSIPLNLLWRELVYTRNFSIILLIIGLCIFSIFLVRMIRTLANPLQHMVSFINDIEEMNGGIQFKTHPCYELANIGTGVVSLVEKNRNINNQLSEIKRNNSKIEYQKLQTQINPHFLYNTLNTVKLMAAINKEDKISRIMTSLIKLLSTSMDKQGEYITVNEEIESIKHYIYIENIVYENKIDFIFEIDETLNHLKVPNFILQPLVENSIMHGIDPSNALGRITIRNYRKGNNLFFEIEDNGRGISKEKLEQILSTINSNIGFSSVGLKSVHNRIRLTYGNPYGISVRSREGEGCAFIIELPVVM